jgi:hypothetical protein
LLVEHQKSGVDESVPEFPYLRRLSRLHLCNDWLSLFFLQLTLPDRPVLKPKHRAGAQMTPPRDRQWHVSQLPSARFRTLQPHESFQIQFGQKKFSQQSMPDR